MIKEAIVETLAAGRPVQIDRHIADLCSEIRMMEIEAGSELPWWFVGARASRPAFLLLVQELRPE